MTEHRKLDDPLAAPLARALAAGLDRTGRECPEAETLGLYFDRALAADEAARWEMHFSACARCQEQLAAMARIETAAAPATPEAARPSGVSWPWNWRWLAPAAAALGALAIWVVVSNMTTSTTPTKTTIAENLKREPSGDVARATSPQKPEGDEQAQEIAGKVVAPASGPASAPPASRSTEGLTSEAGAKQAPPADLAFNATKPAEADKYAATTRLADRADAAPSRKAPGATGVGALQAAPGVSPEKDKKETASEFALQVEAQKPKEEALRERPAQAVEISTPRQQAGLDTQQAAAQTSPARTNEQSAQASREAFEKRQAAPQTARDESKKTDTRAAEPVAGAVLVESQPAVNKLRQESETGGRYRAANVVGSQVVWRLGPGGSIERSTDGGATWQRQSSGVTADLLAGSAPSPTVCWAVGRGGVVLRTTDGNTWSQLGSPTSQDLVAVVAADADGATVTTADGKRYATTDGGRTWRSQ